MKTAKQALKIALSIVYILAVIFVVDSAFGVFMRGPGKPHDKLNYMIDGVDCDILIVGSSRAFRHYDAKMMSDSLGIKVYNAGYDGVNSAFIYPVLESMLRNHRPRMIIYETLPWEFFSSKANQYVGLLKSMYGHTDEISIQLDNNGYNKYNVLQSNLIKYNSPLVGLFSLQSTYNDPYGFEPVYKEGGHLEEEQIEEELVEHNQLVYDNFTKIIRLAENFNIPIIAVFSPCYSRADSAPTKAERIITSFKIPFINNFCLRFGEQPEEYFRDVTHLNDKGARLYTRHFIGQIKPYLEESGILPAMKPSESSQGAPSEIND